jgi:RNA polymerase sigma-70 factor (ECF subfamily)
VELNDRVTEIERAGHGESVAVGPEHEPAQRDPLEGDRLAKPAFDDLYDAHFDFVWRNLRRLGVLEPNLWDAAQDVFLVIHRRLADFEPRAEVRSWVYSIVVRVARQHRRTAKRKPTQPLDDHEQLVDPRAIGPERSAARSEELQQLMTLLDQLDDHKREAFVLAELEGLSAPEIAAILNANVNTIYARIRAARRELEAAIQQLPDQAP